MTLAGPPDAGTRRTTQLRQLLETPQLSVLLEAHDGLSARIVSEAGLNGIWASGLTLSASHGVRDSNELSWTQVLDAVAFMVDASDVPILLDADTGFGNFNNVRRLVAKAEQFGIAGICIEDKLFPKTNSFIGERQALADPLEFASKIRAAVDTRTDPDFCIVARVEALIAGWSMDEALRRAWTYHQAGADAILIHSKKSTAEEVLEFARAWNGAAPLIAVPTTYPTTRLATFEEAGFSLIIWANHVQRAAITAMQEVAEIVAHGRSPEEANVPLAPVKEIFRLQRDEELREAERRYLPRWMDR